MCVVFVTVNEEVLLHSNGWLIQRLSGTKQETTILVPV